MAAGVLFLLLCSVSAESAVESERILQPRHLHLALNRDGTGVIVSWVTMQERLGAKHIVQYWVTGGGGRRIAVDSTSRTYAEGSWNGTVHVALLRELSAGARYSYVVGDARSGWFSDEYSFASPVKLPSRDGSTQYSLAFVGDMGVVAEARSIVELLTEDTADAFFHLGDFGYANQSDPRPWNIASPWYVVSKQQHWDAFCDMVEPLTATRPYMTMPGNHEHEPFDHGLVPYAHRFAMPTPSFPNVDLSGWYAFQYGPAAFVVLHSELPFEPGTPQYAFLESSLERIDRNLTPWIVVAVHRPMYSSQGQKKGAGSYLPLRVLEPLLLSSGVQFVLAAHDHSYERTRRIGINGTFDAARGMYHVRVGTGGIDDSALWDAYQPPWSAVRFVRYGYGKLVFSQDARRRHSAEFSFVSTDGVWDRLTVPLRPAEWEEEVRQARRSVAVTLVVAEATLGVFVLIFLWKTLRRYRRNPCRHTPASYELFV